MTEQRHPVTCKQCGADCRDCPTGTPCPSCGSTERVYAVTFDASATAAAVIGSASVIVGRADLKAGAAAVVATGIVEPAPAAGEVTEIEVVGLGKVPITVPPGILTVEERQSLYLRQLVEAVLRVTDFDSAGDSPSKRQVPASFLDDLRAIATDIERLLRFEM